MLGSVLARATALPSFAPRVLPGVLAHVEHEHGTTVSSGERFAVLAHFSPSATVSLSFRSLVREFSRNGYQTIVVSACPEDRPLDWGQPPIGDPVLPAGTVVLRKPNVGYDFGSWAVALTVFPTVADAPHVVLANDSLVGPFASITPLLSDFERTKAQVWGVTASLQYRFHLQSYFLGFRGGVLRDRPLARFWSNIRDERSKWEVIRRNELALGRLVERCGYATGTAFRTADLVRAGENPVIRGWQGLLDKGFPFVKRELVRDPSVAPHGEAVADSVLARFGVDLEEWL